MSVKFFRLPIWPIGSTVPHRFLELLCRLRRISLSKACARSRVAAALPLTAFVFFSVSAIDASKACVISAALDSSFSRAVVNAVLEESPPARRSTFFRHAFNRSAHLSIFSQAPRELMGEIAVQSLDRGWSIRRYLFLDRLTNRPLHICADRGLDHLIEFFSIRSS